MMSGEVKQEDASSTAPPKKARSSSVAGPSAIEVVEEGESVGGSIDRDAHDVEDLSGGEGDAADDEHVGDRLDDIDESGEEESEGLSDMDDDVTWPCSTVMCWADAVDSKLVSYFNKYLEKPGNADRIFQPSMTAALDEDSEGGEEGGEDLPSVDGEQVVDEEYRKCSVAKDTNTLNKLFNMLDDAVDAAVDKFVEKYQFFNIVSTKEDYTLLKFTEGDFFAEHIECTGLNEDGDGASRKLCVYVVLDTPGEGDGGEIQFSYQGCSVHVSPGSIVVFPACPLHPTKISVVETGRLMLVTNYVL